jgi:hypothetical protein
MPPAVAALNIVVGPFWGASGDILEAMGRIAPSQPNEAMARITSRTNGTISLDLSCRVKIPEKGSLNVDLKLFSRVQIDLKEDWAKKGVARDHGQSRTEVQNFTFTVGAVSSGSPL